MMLSLKDPVVGVAMRFMIFAVGLLLSGCTDPPVIKRGQYELPAGALITDAEPGRYGGVFVLNETTQPTTFNPLVPNNLSTSMVLSRLLSGLVDFDPRTEAFLPALAESWTVSADSLIYTISLR